MSGLFWRTSLLFIVLWTSCYPACAQDAEALANRANDYYNEALDTGKAGHYQQACRGFNAAADTYNSAIYALAGAPMATEEERDNVKYVADRLQDNVNDAKEKAKLVCGLTDSPVLETSNSGGENYPSGPSVETMITEGKTLSDEAMAAYEAGDQATSCAKGRRAAEIWAKAYTTLDNTPNADYAAVQALKGNAETSQDYRDAYYCKDQ